MTYVPHIKPTNRDNAKVLKTEAKEQTDKQGNRQNKTDLPSGGLIRQHKKFKMNSRMENDILAGGPEETKRLLCLTWSYQIDIFSAVKINTIFLD